MARLLAIALGLLAVQAAGAAAPPDAAAVVHLLDYIAVDYPGAVAAGKVRDEGEYREMVEFTGSVRASIDRLPAHAHKGELRQGAARLADLVALRSPEGDVAAAASTLKRKLVEAYRVPVGPRRAPDLARGALLYLQHCAGCHGGAGRGDGPLARGLDPAPSDFTDRERQGRRSIHGLYNTITLGVAGTAMQAFPSLSEPDRWALAYLASSWGAGDEEVARGRAAWATGRHRGAFASQAAVAGRTREDVASALGGEAADVLAYLRREPSALDQAKRPPLEVARDKVRESAALHAAGRADDAVQAALAAYLEGFELAEAALATVDAAQVRRVEAAMMDYRSALNTASREQVASRADALDRMLEDAAGAIAGTSLSPAAAALASFLILLREGLEAVLVVAALLAVARRGGSPRSARFLHAGWIAALALGLATWAAATWLVEVSGAGREITEGVAALAASAMLVYVGFWLHGKSHARAWHSFVMRGAEAGRGAAWGLAFMAFLAVYREVFETVLFYQALWTQAPGAGTAIAGGFAAGCAALAAVTWAMLRYAVRLPMGLFFGASGALLAALAVVLAGNGVAALQEAGVVPASPVAFVTITWLGIHPNAEALLTQLAMAAAVVALFMLSRRRAALAGAAEGRTQA